MWSPEDVNEPELADLMDSEYRDHVAAARAMMEAAAAESRQSIPAVFVDEDEQVNNQS